MKCEQSSVLREGGDVTEEAADDQAARLLEQAREIKDPMFVATRVFTRPFFPSGSAVDAILKKAGW